MELLAAKIGSIILKIAVTLCILQEVVAAQQLVNWARQNHEPQQFAAQRPPITAELQNQVQALSAQLAAANRQLQYFQQQLSLANQLQQQPQPTDPSQASAGQQFAAQQPHFAQTAANQAQQSQMMAQAQAQPQQPQRVQAPQMSTLVDDAELEADPRYASQPARVFYQPQVQQQQQQHQQQQQQLAAQQAHAKLAQVQPQTSMFASQQAPTSTTVGPPSIEPSFQPQLAAPQQEAPPANLAPPHNPPKNDDKFSIGLGVLSPGYTQKFGNTALDFNQDKNGFSFTLSNNAHNNNQQQQPAPKPATPTAQRAAS